MPDTLTYATERHAQVVKLFYNALHNIPPIIFHGIKHTQQCSKSLILKQATSQQGYLFSNLLHAITLS